MIRVHLFSILRNPSFIQKKKTEDGPYTTLRLETLARSLGMGPVNRLSLSRLPDKKDNKRNERQFILQFHINRASIHAGTYTYMHNERGREGEIIVFKTN
jgi:hypothetical protein